MALNAGARLGSYEVLGAIGSGGMGEVYRARDTKLNRDVALKVLPELLALDPDRLARFKREAQVLASLNHPNIAAIYGFEESDGVRALVLELVEGPTLAEVIEQASGETTLRRGSAAGPKPDDARTQGLPLDQALPLARQICQALEAAHERGVIHRDLKPANIKITPAGTVKVLDFGLAKLVEGSPPAAGPAKAGHHREATDPAKAGHYREAAAGSGGVWLEPDLSDSPTMSLAATRAGVILGTAAYMAPEQARGKDVDKRTDIWAFGCVLYEMLTGKRAFQGDDVSDTLATVLKTEPEWSALPRDVPPAICVLIQRCLEKDRNRRVADISTALFLINEPTTLAPAAGRTSAPATTVRPPAWRQIAKHGAAALLVSAVVGIGVWFAARSSVPPARVSRLLIAPSSTAALSINGVDRDLAITPDGSRIIYVGNNGTQLFVRALDALEPVAAFRGGPRRPFVSPDGQWVGFVDSNVGLKKVAIAGGPAVTVAPIDGTARGATWAPDDTIIFATGAPTTGLQRVAAAGGTPTVLTQPDRAQGEADHLWPEMLPGGRAVLFTMTAQAGGLDAAQVAVLDLQTGARKVLVGGGSHAHYVSSGHLVYAAAGTLRAVAFDPARLETRGTAVPVVPQVATTTGGGVDAVVAGDGTLAYVSGGVGGAQRTLVWVDRQGQETAIPAPPRAYTYPRISPDGTRIALYSADQENDIWLWDLARTTLTRVTFDSSIDAYPAWTPDGRRLIFSSERAGARNLFWQAADGTGMVERLTRSPNVQNANSVTPDGTQLIFTETDPKTSDDLMEMILDGTRRATPPSVGLDRLSQDYGERRQSGAESAEPGRSVARQVRPLVKTPFSERNGFVSPDGRWLAYEANDSGQYEIYVRPYPDVNSGHWQVSTAGGTRPLWARSGQELFYLSPEGALMRVGVERGQSWASTPPTKLLEPGYFTVPGGNPGRTYDISPDGQRFLMIKAGGGSDQTAAPSSLIVVQNWHEELKRLVPTR